MALPKIETPRYELEIPSTGVKTTYRPYLVKEEKILMMAMESDDNNQMASALKDVVRACVDDAVDVDHLAMFDLEYIFTQLRAKSVGEATRISVDCSSCKEKNEIMVDLSSVYIHNENGFKVQNIQLTDDVGITMKYPSVDAVMKTQRSSNNKKKTSDIDQVFDLIMSCMDSIYSGDEIFDTNEQSREELNDFLESLNSEQFGRIQSFIEDMPQATVDVNYQCSSCGEQNDFSVRGLSNFFG